MVSHLRRSTATIAVLVAIAVLLPAPALARTAEVVRLAGSDRFATASAVSRQAFPSGAETVFVATGSGFADALAGVPAATRAAAPILLVEKDRLPTATADELRRLTPGRIVVLGGRAAVSNAVVDDLGAFAGRVERIAGADRYATAAEVARTFPATTRTAFVATGANFADALAGGAAAGALGAPVLLTLHGSLPSSTRAALDRLSLRDIVVLGGAASVSDAVVNQLRSRYPEATVRRVGGSNRYMTALAVARAFTPTGSPQAVVTTGRGFADALAGGVLAARSGAAVYLVDSHLPAAAQDHLARTGAPSRFFVVGGTAVVSRVAADELRRDGAFEYLVTRLNDDGSAVRWNPCQAIHWVFNPNGAYAGALTDVKEGFRRISQATGLTFVYDGTTSRASANHPVEEGGRYAPIWVGWENLGAYDQGGTLGHATTYRKRYVGRPWALIGATVQFNRNAIGSLSPGYDGAGTNWGEVILHEVGHAMGLDHVDTPGSVMRERPNGGSVGFAPSDLAGLAALGTARGCVTVPPA